MYTYGSKKIYHVFLTYTTCWRIACGSKFLSPEVCCSMCLYINNAHVRMLSSIWVACCFVQTVWFCVFVFVSVICSLWTITAPFLFHNICLLYLPLMATLHLYSISQFKNSLAIMILYIWILLCPQTGHTVQTLPGLILLEAVPTKQV